MYRYIQWVARLFGKLSVSNILWTIQYVLSVCHVLVPCDDKVVIESTKMCTTYSVQCAYTRSHQNHQKGIEFY